MEKVGKTIQSFGTMGQTMGNCRQSSCSVALQSLEGDTKLKTNRREMLDKAAGNKSVGS